MADRFLTKSAIMLILLRYTDNQQEILLQRRKNTGYADGLWDCAVAGHVDAGESMKSAVLREAKEELGIELAKENIGFATITHKYTPSTGDTYYNAFFVATDYHGSPAIMEPEKCSELCWFSIEALPDDLLEDRAQAIHNYLAGVPYMESGWDSQ